MRDDVASAEMIHAFLEQDLPNRPQAETIVLCGSYATGKAVEHSDVDLCYIGDFPRFQRSHGRPSFLRRRNA